MYCGMFCVSTLCQCSVEYTVMLSTLACRVDYITFSNIILHYILSDWLVLRYKIFCYATFYHSIPWYALML